jgi:hypothetical protein
LSWLVVKGIFVPEDRRVEHGMLGNFSSLTCPLYSYYD